MITAISPIDGRYNQSTQSLAAYFSEFALIKYRVFVEIEYLKALHYISLPSLTHLEKEDIDILDSIVSSFSLEDAEQIKSIEKTTNHDVKAVEYFIKSKMATENLAKAKEMVHFGLTSQDINNTAFPLMIKEALQNIVTPALEGLIDSFIQHANEYTGIPMLARTHGQPASPTTLGKEWLVFVERLQDELELLKQAKYKCKFGGATGNFNAHLVTYPDINWQNFSDQFTSKLGITRSKYTTQIAHYDDLAGIFHSFCRMNTILIDFCRDIWTYISLEYFKQKVKAGEVGSSAMPHKVNPIDFENAEGNLGYANAIFTHLAEKLPISRLQRDLTDSTVLRNVGVPFSHTLIAIMSIQKGLQKLTLNATKLNEDLNANWAVVAEAIQNILRRENYDQPYEALKDLTRGKTHITDQDIITFIHSLSVNNDIKNELLSITPHNYVGYY